MARIDSLGGIPTMSGQLSYLQLRTSTISKTLRRSNFKEKAYLSEDNVDQVAHEISKLSKQIALLTTELQVNPVTSSIPTLSTEAVQNLRVLIPQCDAVLDKIYKAVDETELQYLGMYLSATTSTVAAMLQCLKHARLLCSSPQSMSFHQSLRHSSRSRLERRVSEQQTALLHFFGIHHKHGGPRPLTLKAGKEEVISTPDARTLIPFLHPSLSQTQGQRFKDKALEVQVKQVSEQLAQSYLHRWTLKHSPSPLGSPTATTSQFAVQERSGEAEHTSQLDARYIVTPISSSGTSRRHSTLSSSPVTTNGLALRAQVPRSAFSSSFPPSNLNDPPFVVTHAKYQTQAQLNSVAQAQVQAQAQARRDSNDCHSDTQTETSSLFPTADPSSIVVEWRRNALRQHWDFENSQLMHNTGCLSPGAAKDDDRATTEIRKALLKPEALDHFDMQWEETERRVTDAKGSQRKKFVCIKGALDWSQVEALVRLSGKIADEQGDRRQKRREARKSMIRLQTAPDQAKQIGLGLGVPRRRRESSPGPVRPVGHRSQSRVRFEDDMQRSQRHERPQNQSSQRRVPDETRRRRNSSTHGDSEGDHSRRQSREYSRYDETEAKSKAVVGRLARAGGIGAILPGLLGDVLLG